MSDWLKDHDPLSPLDVILGLLFLIGLPAALMLFLG
jgi:hypothetical protein